MARVLTPAMIPVEKVSFEEFLRWGDDTFTEWVAGQILLMPHGTLETQRCFGFLLTSIGLFVEVKNLGTVLTAPFVMYLPTRPSGRAPDIMFIAAENRMRLHTYYFDGPADLVIEIVCEESSLSDKTIKFAEYEEAGVSEYWIIDPLEQEALFYQRDGNGKYQEISVGEDGRYESAVLEGFWLKVDWLWQDPLPLLEAARELQLMA